MRFLFFPAGLFFEKPRKIFFAGDVRAADGRLQAGAQVGLGRAVLGVGEDHQLVEVLAEDLAVQGEALVLQGDQPQDLDVQIVVGQGLARHFVCVIGHVVFLAVPLHGHAQGAADVFADPAARKPAAVFGERKVHRAIPP